MVDKDKGRKSNTGFLKKVFLSNKWMSLSWPKFQEHFVLIKDDLYFIKVMHHLREGVLAQCSFDIVQNLQLRQT